MRRISILVLAVVALAGLGYLSLRDEGHGLDMDAITECRRPEIRTPTPHDEVDLGLQLRLEPFADLDSALAMDHWPDGRLVVALRTGPVVLLDADGEVDEILDLTDRIALNAEGGVLGLAVDPSETFVYVHHTDLDGTSHLLSFPIDDGEIDLDSERDLLQQPHPGLVHNGGNLVFGPDDLLYLGFGDGSQEVEEALRSEDRSSLAGKLLRIEPTPEDDAPYRIPETNPDPDGERGAPEIWAHGFRNPWRFDFDTETGDLWIGDVGNDCWEEIDVLPSGTADLDFGWPRYEGNHALAEAVDDGETTWPIRAIRHGDACAIVAGTVYRGTEIPDLDGRFLYQDLCEGELRWLERTDEGTRGGMLGVQQEFVLAFWADDAGELYVLTAENGIKRLHDASTD